MYLDKMVILYVVNPLYAAIRKSEDDLLLPMGDPAMTNSYMGLAYDICVKGLQISIGLPVYQHLLCA